MAPILPPNQIPAPLPPWSRLLLQLLPFLPTPQQSVLDYIMELFDTDGAEPTRWVRAQVVWEHIANIDPADRYVNTLDVINITGGNIDNSWTQADFDDLTAGLNTMLTQLLPRVSTDMRCKEYRYYQMYFNPITPVEERGPDWKDDPYGPSGPPVLIHAVTTPGTNPQISLPAQMSMSVTEKTPYPRHWGRMYLPATTPDAMTSTGHFTTAAVTAVADAVEAGFDYLHTKELYPVVPVVQVDNQPFRGLLQVNQIQVDNVPDVQRRRRPKSTTVRVTRP